ncbi:MAG: ATP-binding protein [Thermoleophilia bacterium]|jgi:2-oxoglutarate ferredoxin oxidoreductase subunit delta
MNAPTNIITKRLPEFLVERCKQCGICIHFCAPKALAAGDDGVPYLADHDACTSCGLCRDMCPDWAICLTPCPTEVHSSPEPTPVRSPAPPVQ